MKRTAPLVIATTAGIVMIISYFIPDLQDWGEHVSLWFDIIAAIAFILGGGNLIKQHLKKVSDKKAGWGFSAVTIIAFLAMLSAGLLKLGVPPAARYPEYAWSGLMDATGGWFWWGYEYAFKPLTATMFSMLAFYVATAAFRAFRAKNIEAVLLLGTAFIVLLGRTFAGVWLTSRLPAWLSGLKLEELSVYIMQVANTAGNRAIMIGIALGTASVCLKILLGIDRSYLGSGEE